MDIEHIGSLRQICLSFPEAVEKETWGQPTFRVNEKMFVWSSSHETVDPTMTLKAPSGEQELLLTSDSRFFYPAYVGSKGWIGINLNDTTDWEEIRELVEDSYRLVAPKRLVKVLDR